VALVGTTGAGKSTLVNLLSRFYEYDTGEILVDGKPLREYGTKRLREFVGVVTQESFLFNGTVRENLRMGKPNATTRNFCAPRSSELPASSSIGCRKGSIASWASVGEVERG
jgi:ABC-type multidrug transport system fused ATPase/permease subunit